MDKNIAIVGPIIQKWPYRKARLEGWSCCVPLSEADKYYLRRKMTRNGFTLDNHIVFATAESLFWYSDDNLYIGGKLVLGSW